MKILIVDDNPAIRRLIDGMLKDIVDEIRQCADGNDAPQAYSEFRPDFVLMDIGMKQMDGITATEEIIKIDPTARIILVTDYADPIFRKCATEAGAFGFVLKENLSELQTIIRVVLT